MVTFRSLHRCLLFILLMLCLASQHQTFADLIDIQTRVSGTSADDTISNDTLIFKFVDLTTSSVEDVTTGAIGIDGMGGNDTITGQTLADISASSTMYVDYTPSDTFGGTARANTIGFTGGTGTDGLTNASSLFSAADTLAFIFDVTVQIDPGLLEIPTEAISSATGLQGGDGPDTMTNSGYINTTATAYAEIQESHFSAAEIPAEILGWGDGKTIATATTIAMDGDMQTGAPSTEPGSTETITNSGTLAALSDADAVKYIGMLELIGAARVDDSTEARAYSAGIFGGVNDTVITNSGTIDVDALAEADMTSWEIKMKGLMAKPVLDLFGMDVGTYQTTSDTVAVGLAGNTGNDEITNTGIVGESYIDVYAFSRADADTYTLAVSPPLGSSSQNVSTVSACGVFLPDLSIEPDADTLLTDAAGESYANARALATGYAVGMSGDAGNDTLISRVPITAQTLSRASNKAVSVDISLSSTSFLPLPGAAVTDTSAAAIAMSTGMAGGDGTDTVTNNSRIAATATADGDALGASAVLKGSTEGLNIGATVSEAGSEAVALSKGIVGGTGADTLENNGRIAANAISTDDSTSISISLAGDKVGVAAGVTLADAKTRSEAYAIGMDGEDFGTDESQSIATQEDRIINNGQVTASADTDANSLSVGFSVSGSLHGVGISVALAETDTETEAQAMGIRGGIGQDHIENNGVSGISATSTANSTSNAVNVAVSAAYEGLAMGAAFATSDTTATADAAGIDSGDSEDFILSSAPITTSASANSTSNTINVNASLALKGFSMGAAATDTKTLATAEVRAISGKDGDDYIENTGFTQTTATATTRTKTVTVNFAEAGTAIADVSSEATARATGFDGGTGENEVKNSGTALVTATSNASNKNATVNFAGYAQADISPTSVAKAVGMNGKDEDGTSSEANTLTNQIGGTLIITAAANADTDNYVIQGGGGIMADVQTTADALAIGQQSGSGNDKLGNDGTLVALANGEIKASSVNFQLSGLTAGAVGINANGTAIGMDAGDGINTLTNFENGYIFTKSDITTSSLNSQFSMGVNVSLTGVTAQGYSGGMVSGTGDDTLYNYGNIKATSNVSGNAAGASLGLVGLGLSTALADVELEGISSGGGNDTLTNSGDITISALDTGDNYLAKAHTEAVSLNLVSFVNTVLGARADLTGMNGGTGNDTLTNTGAIYIGEEGDGDVCTNEKCMVIGKSVGYGGQFLGAAFVYAGSSAKTNSTGIDGGDGMDTLTNSGRVTVKARSYGDVDCIADVDIGAVPSSATASSATEASATGLDGGTGDDTLENSGLITADAFTISDAYAKSVVSLFNNPHAKSNATAKAWAYGLYGGTLGTKVIHNSGNVSVLANAGALPTAVSDSDTATTYTEGWGLAQSHAAGIQSDGHTSFITNFEDGVLTVSAKAGTYDTLDNIAKSNTDEECAMDAGNYGAGIPISAVSNGIETFSGKDTIENFGSITVSADAQGSVNTHSDSYPYDIHSTARSMVLAQAAGIRAGTGANNVKNTGDINATAISYAAPNAYGESSMGTSTCTAEALSDAEALGMIGDGTLTNAESGNLNATARATSYAVSVSPASYITVSAALNAVATGFSPETMDDPAESLTITNAGDAQIRALAGEDETGNSQQTVLAVPLLFMSYDTTTTNTSFADAAGIRAGDGQKQITNTGTLTVLAWVRADIAIEDYDLDLIPGFPTFINTTTANAEGSSLATGVLALAGDNTVHNSGTLTVNAKAEDVSAFSEASALSAHAIAKAVSSSRGILLGHGTDSIINSGTLTVSAISGPAAGDDSSQSITYHVKATAAAEGMNAGNGSNTLENSGQLNVSALSCPSVYFGNGGHDSIGLNLSIAASAVGMAGGNDDDVIYNSGSLKATATADFFSSVPSLLFDLGSASATGISGGDGDDYIYNSGEIVSQTTVKKVFLAGWYYSIAPGIAIDAGAGNDTVELDNGTLIVGDILLASGNDTLILKGTPVIDGNIDPGEGQNILIMNEDGSSDKTFAGFTHAAKTGSGTFVISGLSTVNQLSVDQGTLQVNADYRFADTGLFSTPVMADGGHGQLAITGTGVLGGELEVLKEDAFYGQARTYDIIAAASLTGEFDEVMLPESTSLLTFSMEQTADSILVSATPQSSTTVATNAVERSIGRYLDTIAPTAQGDLASVLKTFQLLSPDQFKTAFSGFSPANLGVMSDIGHHVVQSAIQPITSHLQTKQQSASTLSFAPKTPVLLSSNYSGHLPGASENSSPQGKSNSFGVWAKGFGRWGNQESSEGFNGYDFSTYGGAVGMDYAFNNGLIGVSFERSNAFQDFNSDSGCGIIHTVLTSLYADIYLDHFSIESIITYGWQEYENKRNIIIGDILRQAVSNHDSNLFSAYLGGAYHLSKGMWSFAPFANMQYTLIDEDAFSESGAADLNLVINEKTTKAMVSQLGVQASRPFNRRSGYLVPKISLAGIYDFDIDDRAITAGFAGSPDDTFTIGSQDIDQFGVALEAELSRIYDNGFGMSINYSGEFRKSYTSQRISGMIGSRKGFSTSIGYANNFQEGHPEKGVLGEIKIRF